MTDTPTGTGLATTDTWKPGDPLPGMEDFSTDDLVMPRLVLNHKDATFKDSLSGEEFKTLDSVIILGLINQRVLWDAEVSEGKSAPLCKSVDGKFGFANPKTFPWKTAKLVASDFDEEAPQVTCANCHLKEWGTHPNNDTPYCTEQKTLVILQPVSGIDGAYAPALLTVQRSAIKAVNSYFSSFQRSQMPSFTAITTIGLNAQKRGSVEYAVPTFAKVGDSDEAAWPDYANQYRLVRTIVTKPPTTGAETVEASAKADDSSSDDEDLPF